MWRRPAFRSARGLLRFERLNGLLQIALTSGGATALGLQLRSRLLGRPALGLQLRSRLLDRPAQLAQLGLARRAGRLFRLERGHGLLQSLTKRHSGCLFGLEGRPRFGTNRRRKALPLPLGFEAGLACRRVRFFGGHTGQVEDQLLKRAMLARIGQSRLQCVEARVQHASKRLDFAWKGWETGVHSVVLL